MYIVLNVHHNSADHIIRVGKYDSPTTLVETFQRNLRRLDQPDGVTWRVVEGGIVSALVANSAK